MRRQLSALRLSALRVSALRGRPVSGAFLVGCGLVVFLLGGVLTALLAARFLPAPDYTIYAAYSSLIGILVLGPAGSLEQESALRSSRAHDSGRGLLTAMLLRGAAIFVVVAAVVLLPVGGWQERVLGASAGLAAACVLLGGPLVFSAAVGRGYLTAHGMLAPVASANAATGTAMLLLPPVLHAVGLPWLPSFLVGALLAWLPALVVIGARTPGAAARPPTSDAVAGDLRHGVTAWLLAGNLLMLTTLLAVPVVLRWHVEDLGADRVADAQLLVSVSRLSTTVVLGFLALMVAQLSVPDRRPGIARRWLAVATALGLATVGGLAIVGSPLVSWLRGDESHLSLGANVLATLPAATLCPAVVAMALAIVRHRWGLVVGAWSAALAVLGAAAALDPDGNLVGVLGLIALAGVVPLAVLCAGLAWRSRARSDVVT